MKKEAFVFTIALLLGAALLSTDAHAFAFEADGGGEPIVLTDGSGGGGDAPATKSWQRIFPTRTH